MNALLPVLPFEKDEGVRRGGFETRPYKKSPKIGGYKGVEECL